ncbi:hypothetical protein [Corynebacterium cystitidis]|uniref:Uncharacterized protein n=1 Tax=Corynebacterium cystitidis DSM 20524 TaxID=1121357 RepID=A0A1H9WMH2_9CORY|nr:hypothetical protein [Corynebacterium cystitidis]WJY82840.1 hypothetical protein CCYS_09630 [Corynebacterium cystitidis DSM 20524]SES35021.1 hypothetical protein SAMN05661109_02811 [Corynebacterium cystitidis DSM 20524]SNV69936.1 Uncharacterised protein [Corynebacterium cystitidis]
MSAHYPGEDAVIDDASGRNGTMPRFAYRYEVRDSSGEMLSSFGYQATALEVTRKLNAIGEGCTCYSVMWQKLEH